MASKLVCVQCERVGNSKRITPGSLGLEVVLWLGGFALLPVGIGVLVLIGALAYSIWRLAAKYDGCPSCGARSMVPADSPAGQRITRNN